MGKHTNRPGPAATSAPRRFPWKWLALAVVLGGAGIGAAIILSGDKPWGGAPPGMVWVPGGTFRMGTDDPNYRFQDAKPVHEVFVSGFWMDETEVTNEQFAAFVAATGYVTIAEQKPSKEILLATMPKGNPLPPDEDLVPGSVVFVPPEKEVPFEREGDWTKWVPGACWKHPEGPGSDIKDRMNHPVVQVCFKDAEAYCKWAGKRLPTEAEWERAARGGLDGKPFAWGDEPIEANGQWRCNIWQGRFGGKPNALDGHVRTAPVKSFAPNGFGLYDVAGNVWEWCADWYTPGYYLVSPRENPKGPDGSYDPSRPDEAHVPKRVQRGGSFLCSDGFCARYKPAGRGKGEVYTGSSHVGFRCARDR